MKLKKPVMIEIGKHHFAQRPACFHRSSNGSLEIHQKDLSKLFAPENETVSEYDKKLAMARSLLVNMTETTAVENEPRAFIQKDKRPKKSDAELAWVTLATFS